MSNLKRYLTRSIALAVVFLSAYFLMFMIQWGGQLTLPHPSLLAIVKGGGFMPRFISWRAVLSCVTENCAAYAIWAFALAWLFRGFEEKLLSNVRRRAALLANFMIASVLCLQLLLTESVSNCGCPSAWIMFLSSHMTGLTGLFLLASFLSILADNETRLVRYAFIACLVYGAMVAVLCLLPVSRTALRCGLVACMVAAFIAFATADLFSAKRRKIRNDAGFPSRWIIVRVVVYAAVCISYCGCMTFWIKFGRRTALLLQERFLLARAPHSVAALRTDIHTERDVLRGRFQSMVDASFSNSWVEVGMELMRNPARYGADPAVTNMLRVLARDEQGNVVQGWDAIETMAEPKDANDEFAKVLSNVDGKLSDIRLSDEVVDRVTESSRSRISDAEIVPANLFLLHTRDGRDFICRVGRDSNVGRDTYNFIKILNGGAINNVTTNGTYGSADINLNEILAFSAYSSPSALLNEIICMAAFMHTLERLNLVLDYNVSWQNTFSKATDPELCEELRSQFETNMLDEKEVDEIRHAFIDAINDKRGLTLTGWSWLRDRLSTVMLIISYLGLLLNRKRMLLFARRITPRTKLGIVGLALFAVVCGLVTFQLARYLTLWRNRRKKKMQIAKIISGGQTGVDRGAIAAALELGFPYGGLIPKGRRAEDGIVPLEFAAMTEDTRKDYLHRTELNVVDADATLILSLSSTLTGGTKRTADFCAKHGKPYWIDNPEHPKETDRGLELLQWTESKFGGRGIVLNVAGPRESKAPGIQEKTKAFIKRLIEEGGL